MRISINNKQELNEIDFIECLEPYESCAAPDGTYRFIVENGNRVYVLDGPDCDDQGYKYEDIIFTATPNKELMNALFDAIRSIEKNLSREEYIDKVKEIVAKHNEAYGTLEDIPVEHHCYECNCSNCEDRGYDNRSKEDKINAVVFVILKGQALWDNDILLKMFEELSAHGVTPDEIRDSLRDALTVYDSNGNAMSDTSDVMEEFINTYDKFLEDGNRANGDRNG